MPPTIHLVRHAQGFHNLSVENESLRDPDLTALGEQQCADLRSAFPSHARLTGLVASPLRRTIQTCDLAFGGADKLYPIVLLDTLQEVSGAPCDTGSSKAALRAEFGDKIDLQRVRDSWTEKGEGSAFEPTMEALMARAKTARRALREMAGDGDDEIAVVSHGGFLHFLTDDWDGVPLDKGSLATAWTNCMCRSYQFAESPDDKDDVRLVETKESWARRQPTSRQPLTATEQREIRAIVQKRLVPYLKIKA
ncbi:phosphoglycerate mutase family protein [Metarhizium guizhouense ARSEF 977]|uniref:Phosphoglycerate mutase family protein n=1 Tax=Metarhizium guizhouense (strain ARSEF 977) TaxID=1276136 RepID=A0A0B4HS03_METGA|nr:phosphoglycerate mutase family protein [Metarhizium guizhouense ARSEF 977]